MSKIKTFFRLLGSEPQKLVRAAASNNLLNFIPDPVYLRLVFRAELGYPLDLKDPVTYNEKLQWIKLYDRNPDYTIYADKYLVREYIKNKIGEKYLIPLVGVYDTVDDIDWEMLPNRFVLKCTHGSGCNIICRNKAQLNIDEAKKKLKKWMRKSWYWFGREWAYKNIKPRIICEEFLETPDGNTPTDYKFMCFNGQPKLIQVHQDRYGHHTKDFYDMDWNKTNISSGGVPNSSKSVPKPSSYAEMLEISKQLSAGMPYARIDLYDQDGRVFFGEITMYPTSGFAPFNSYEVDKTLGSWIQLPKI